MPPRSARSLTMQTLTPESLLHLKTHSLTRARDLSREIVRLNHNADDADPKLHVAIARMSEDAYLMELAYLAACYAEQHGLR